MKKAIGTKRIIIAGAIVIAICAAGLWLQRDTVGMYCRQWGSAQRHFQVDSKGEFTLRSPFLSNSIARQDPEAAAIADFIIKEWNGSGRKYQFDAIESLSELALKYPDNPYFLYDLTCRVAQNMYVDPQVIHRLADRLLQIDPDNGRYYFLKAWATFFDWDNNNLNTTIDWLEKGATMPKNTDPYLYYKKRVGSLVEQEAPIFFIQNHIDMFSTFSEISLSSRLGDSIKKRVQDMIVNGQTEEAMQVSDRMQRITETSIPDVVYSPRPLFWGCPTDGSLSQLELQWAALSPERARELRRRMLGWKLVWDSIHAQRPARSKEPSQIRTAVNNHFVPIAAHGFQLLAGSFAAAALFGVFSLLAKPQNSHLSVWRLVGIAVFILLYFLLFRWADYKTMHTCCGGHYTLESVIFFATITPWLQLAKPYSLIILPAAICLFSAVLLYAVCRKKRSVVCRIGLYIAGFLLSVSLLIQFTSPYYHASVFDFIVLLFAAAGLSTPLGRSTTLPLAEWLTRCFAATLLIAALHLAAFTVFSPLLMAKVRYEIQDYQPVYRTAPITPARYAVTEQDYINLIASLRDGKAEDIIVSPQTLNMVDPEDLPDILTSIQTRFLNRIAQENLSPDDPFVIAGMSNAGYPPTYLLSNLMAICGKDVKPLIFPFVYTTETRDTILSRAANGDTSVHDQIVAYWHYYRDSGFEEFEDDPDAASKPSAFNRQFEKRSILVSPSVLFAVCSYEEFREYYLEYFAAMSQKYGGFDVCPVIMERLTRQQRAEMINHIVPIKRPFSPSAIRELLSYSADIDQAVHRQLWKTLCQMYNNPEFDEFRDRLTLINRPYAPPPEDRVAQLANSRNPGLRAMAQHLYRRRQQPVDAALLEKWRQDDSFVVRATAALLGPQQRDYGDPHPFVRLLDYLGRIPDGWPLQK